VSNSQEAAFSALNAIADRLQPHQEMLARAWSRFFGATANAVQELSILRSTIAQVNRAIALEAPAIAEATGNSIHHIRSFQPSGIDAELQVWFDDHYPADFLRCVARYRSFSTATWRGRGWKGFAGPDRAVAQVSA